MLLGAGTGAAAQGGPTVSIESQEAVIGDSVDVPVETSGFGDIAAVSLTVTYDPSVVSFSESADTDDLDTDDLITGAPREDFTASVPEPGEVRISWFDASGADPISGGDKVLLRLTFDRYSGGTSQVEFESESEISNPQSEPYGASYRNGRVENAASRVDVSVRRQFEDATDQSNYELVALPGRPGVALSETVTGRQGTGWRGFRELGASGSGGDAELEECTSGGADGENCTFEAGGGFWVISRNDWSFDGTVTGVGGGGGDVSIPLHGGWNLVSNPLREDLSWASVQAANGLSQALYQWTSEGTWEKASTMLSAMEGEAYYVFNGAGLSSLALPATALGSAQAGASSGLRAPMASPRQTADRHESAYRGGAAHRGSASHRGGADYGSPAGRARNSRTGPRPPGMPSGGRAAYAWPGQFQLGGRNRASVSSSVTGNAPVGNAPVGNAPVSSALGGGDLEGNAMEENVTGAKVAQAKVAQSKTTGGKAIRNGPDRSGREGKTLEVRAEVGGKKIGSVTVGTDPSLGEPETYRAPPGHFTEASFQVVGPDGSGPALTRKVLPPGSQAQRFLLLLEGPPGAAARLVASGLEEWASCRVSVARSEASLPGDGTLDPSAEIPLPEDGKILLRLRLEEN